MPRKREPSFELKKIIWDVAIKVGKDKLAAIQRQLEYEMFELDKQGDQKFFENAPDERTIKRIIDKDINELPVEFVLAKLPDYLWHLRNDYETLRRRAEAKEKQPDLKSERFGLVRRHDELVFREADSILNEMYFLHILSDLDEGHYWFRSQWEKFAEFHAFFTYESNKYLLPEVRNSCNKLCKALDKLRDFTSSEFSTMDYEYFINKLKGKISSGGFLSEKEKREFIRQLLSDWENTQGDMSDLHPELRPEVKSNGVQLQEDPEYDEYVWQLIALTEKCWEAYIRYRTTVRETLFV